VAIQWKWRCPFWATSFGLGNEYIEGVYEELFVLKFHGGWGFTEAYNLPIKVRRWFLKKLNEQFEFEASEMEKARKKR
jgi:hypothetical protein